MHGHLKLDLKTGVMIMLDLKTGVKTFFVPGAACLRRILQYGRKELMITWPRSSGNVTAIRLKYKATV